MECWSNGISRSQGSTLHHPISPSLHLSITPSPRNILGAHFQTFVLVFPDDGRIKIEEFRGDLRARQRQQTFGVLGGFFEGVIVISGALLLALVPMGHGMHGRVLLGPRPDGGLEFGREFFKGRCRARTMLTNQTRFQHVAGEEGQ